MIYGKKDIKEYFKKLGKKYFAVFKRGSIEAGNPIYKTEEEAEIDTDEAYRSFEEVLAMLRTGEYTLICNNDPKVTARGGARIDFRISMEDSMTEQSREAVTGIGNIGGPVDYDAMMTKAKVMASEEFEKLMQKRDLDDLKARHDQALKELKEAQQRVDDPFNKFIAAIAPHADGLVGSLMGKPAAPLLTASVGSIAPDLHLDENATTDEYKEHAQTVFEDFAGALQTAKPKEFLEILVKLTTLIRNNPQKFETAINFL